MIRVTGRYTKQTLQLDRPLNLADGEEVEVLIAESDREKEEWSQLGMSRLEEAWDNPQDAIYDDWKKHYGV